MAAEVQSCVTETAAVPTETLASPACLATCRALEQESSVVVDDANRQRSRSRSPVGDGRAGAATGTGFAAAMRSALRKRLPIAGAQFGSEENDESGEDEENDGIVDCSDQLADGEHLEMHDRDSLPHVQCAGCRATFLNAADLFEHARAAVEAIEVHHRKKRKDSGDQKPVGVSCAVNAMAEDWQAVVKAATSMPGAGSMLWCPACPLDGGRRWSGHATKAGAFLRHLGAAQPSTHRRLLKSLARRYVDDPPFADSNEGIHGWASRSPLLLAAGPLLATPSLAAQQAIWKWEDDTLGPDAVLAALRASVPTEAKTKDDRQDSEEEVFGDEKQALRILGRDLTVEGSGLYDEEVPLDGGCFVPPISADDGPMTGCSLPVGGAAALKCFDLTLSSEEEEERTPAQQPLGTNTEAREASAGAAKAAVSAAHTFV